MKKLKRILAVVVGVVILMAFFSKQSYAYPAPPLSSVTITDLAVDDNNEIHIEVQIIGTGNAYVCWVDNIVRSRNYSEGYNLVNSSGVVYGEVVYYHTGLYYVPENYGQTLHCKFQATNAMSPWNTLVTQEQFVIPGL